jgi:DeoR family transcriptional regulator, ulaG and ulaABCDEF operon transcriptional repressor
LIETPVIIAQMFTMHVTEREEIIEQLLTRKGFVSFRDLEALLDGSPATIRRDLERMATEGRLERVRGGARAVAAPSDTSAEITPRLAGVPFHENIGRNRSEKEAIGRAAATLCQAGEGVMIDGGSTTLQMCPHLAGLNLSVLTNSLYIVSALMNQVGTRVLVPSGTVFPEQNIILPPFGEDGMPQFHAPRLFMGAACIGPQGLMQADTLLCAAERRLIDRADEIVVLADSSKFHAQSGNVVCALSAINVLITDAAIPAAAKAMCEDAGVRVVIA